MPGVGTLGTQPLHTAFAMYIYIYWCLFLASIKGVHLTPFFARKVLHVHQQQYIQHAVDYAESRWFTP